ncbi:maleylpyruvate isomerase family mycothiol-dependent enzyme [Blastococcus litoris]|uniref:maleylpyruvate isomerase family mycothiol-dependent enzyme n=1 Tax=Blastococcus litoris TaxID=2171622 RepID=UPI000E307617|nr:maleylpyruvate isomerase family mycothiol-dependent enzyme [Blastococcus litoris]
MTEQQRQWWTDGERVVADLISGLSDDELRADSALPAWSRAHVVAHLARNADALVNLLTWAQTGVETPMYPSREARDAAIEQTAALPAAELRGYYTAAARRLAQEADGMPDDAWDVEVRNGQGVPVPVALVPWMRAKEVWVHGTDLRAGLAFADLRADLCEALVDDVLGLFASRSQTPDLTLVATDVDRTWGSGETEIEGPVAAIAAWLTRGERDGLTGDVPPPPAWL